MKLINVRLDAEDARKAAQLRRKGVQISAIVREAIRAEYERRRTRKRGERKASDVVDAIIARHPRADDEPPRDYNVHDRHEARAAILKSLQKKLRKRSA
jgi:post-segregation antitoxin (ccd killing protein)